MVRCATSWQARAGHLGQTMSHRTDSRPVDVSRILAEYRTQRCDVLIPHRDDLPGLQRSLASLVTQTWQGPLRVVVADDASTHTDATGLRQVLVGSGLEFNLSFDRKWRGRPYTRNRLLERSESPWTSWLDAGDVWYDTKLELQFAHLARLAARGVDLGRVWVTCDYHQAWSNRALELFMQEPSDDPARALLEGQTLRAYLWTLLGTRAAMRWVGKFDERLTRLQDLDFFLRFVQAGGRLEVPERFENSGGLPLCRYEKSDQGRSAQEIHRASLLILQKHRTLIRSYGARFERQRRIQADILALRVAKNNRDYATVARYAVQGLLRDPIQTVSQLYHKTARRPR